MELPDFKEKFGVDAYLPHRDGLLYKYFNMERGIQLVSQEALYFASPFQLNDSFELDEDKIKFDMTDGNIWSLLKRMYPNDLIKQTEVFELSKKNRHLVPEVMKAQMSRIRQECGVCCFTTDPRNKLMWGHYGSADTGVVIGFDLPPFSLHVKDLFVMKVLYEEERSFINYFDKPFTIFPIWAFVKNIDWAYEKEIRAVAMSYNGLLKFDISSIQEIHYGMKAKDEHIGQIESLMALKNYAGYKRFHIEKSDNSFAYLSTPF